MNAANVCLDVQLGRLQLSNPILVASGTFGYAREMAGFVDLARLGGILPKTITEEPRSGNRPPRTVETTGGMLNSIGLDNDGIEAFIERQLPFMAELGTAIIVSIAGRTQDEFARLAARLDRVTGTAALELNISCPNVTGGVDMGTDPRLCEALVRRVRDACSLPILAKLTPNVTNIVEMAQAAASAGADAVSLINTCLGMAVDWRGRRPRLGGVLGGLSGPAIKPIALRAVYQVARAVDVPICGIGGIGSIDDVMEFLVAGATAVQIGTANFYMDALASRLEGFLMGVFGVPADATASLIVGFLRKDLAIGLLPLDAMTNYQVFKSVVLLTIYFPCLATFAMLLRELNWKEILSTLGFLIVMIFVFGGILNLIGMVGGWS